MGRVSAFLVLPILYAVMVQGQEAWLDFSCHNGYDKATFDKMMEPCSNINSEWKWAPRTKCFKACQLGVLNIISKIEKDEDEIDFHMYAEIVEEINKVLPGNARAASGISKTMFIYCKGLVHPINEKKQHCDQWDELYSCLKDQLRCG